ncbi:hypothetical protein LCGC14_0374770 [marine sediment metagenome]|uniref:Integrase catalytic domain-containing protein n=1 Tax=marine sediment metagenome TaxID=412755 RepID=A0A0F9TMC8_9ZZZZ
MTSCPKCESQEIMKFGFNYYKEKKIQKYKCSSCNKIFSYHNRIPKTSVPSEVISLCFDLYLKGLSYRVIKQQLLEQFNLKVSHNTIYYWMQTYTKIIKKYTDSLEPELSAVWQMDETFITFKGKGKPNKIELSDGSWCWVCIDTVTRFVLAMHLACDKGFLSGNIFFKKIKEYTSYKPQVIVSDGNPTYRQCTKIHYPKASHSIIKAISIKPNTSFIERFNGTIKNRTKTMRCFDSFGSCQTTMDAFQIYYNFLRPHMALDGKTPAQVAGISANFPNRWVSLIKKSLLFS